MQTGKRRKHANLMLLGFQVRGAGAFGETCLERLTSRHGN